LNIEKQYQEDHSAKLIVEIDPDTMNVYKRRAATKLSSQSKIPGFRPGKAPYEIILRTLGEAAVVEQAINLFIDSEFSKIIKEADVNPGAVGELEAVESLEPPKIVFSVPLAPEVELGDYHSMRIPYEWTAPEQKEIDSTLDDIRRMYAATETVDRAVELGDYVLLDVISETQELNNMGFAALVREEERDSELPYRGFAKELIGLKPGERKAIKHEFPHDWEITELQGKSVDLIAAIKTVRSMTLPDLDDAFAKTTGMGDTLDALKEIVTKDVAKRSQEEYDDRYYVALVEKIREGATIKCNQVTLAHEVEHVLEDLANSIAQENMDLETYFKMRKTTREKFIADEVNPVAKKRLERGLIIEEVVRQEKIIINKDALNAEYDVAMRSLAAQGVDFSKMTGDKQKQARQEVAKEAANRIMMRQAFNILKTVAIGEYKPVEEAKEENTASVESAS